MRTVRLVRSTVELPTIGRDSYVHVEWPPNPQIAGLLRATYLVLESGDITLDDDGRVVSTLPPGGDDEWNP